MILHPEFINDHVKNARIGYFIQGSRVLLTKKKTSEVIVKNKTSFIFFSLGLMNRLNAFFLELQVMLIYQNQYFLQEKL